MKRILVFAMVLLLTATMCACGNKDNDTSVVDNYKKVVQEYIDKGDMETAKKALEEGIALTGDEDLKSLLKVIEMNNSTEEASTVGDKEPVKEEKTEKPEVKEDKTPVEILDQLSAEKRRDLNIFMSNFSEAYFENYSSESYDNAQLINYSFTHNNINKPDEIVWDSSQMGISADLVNKDLDRFFGKSVPRNSVGEWTYADGYFYQPAAMGEFYGIFSIVTKLVDNKDGTFDVEFSVFSDTENFGEVSLSEWYSYTEAQARAKCDFSGTGRAKIKAKTYNGNETYELLEYYR